MQVALAVVNCSHQRARWLEFYQTATRSDIQLAILFPFFSKTNVKVHETEICKTMKGSSRPLL
jgi:hypothetical protein